MTFNDNQDIGILRTSANNYKGLAKSLAYPFIRVGPNLHFIRKSPNLPHTLISGSTTYFTSAVPSKLQREKSLKKYEKNNDLTYNPFSVTM